MSSTLALNILTNFITEHCGTCGVTYAFPQWFYDERERDHDKWFYCPNGHKWHYVGETEVDALRHQLEVAKRDAEWQRQLREKADKINRKLQRRIANGVCPCCKRHFDNVQRHIEQQHPDYSKPKVAKT